MAVMGETSEYREEFSIMNIVIPFGFIKCL
jgi:hypothetical protein